MRTPTFPACYFNGRDAQATVVAVRLDDASLVIETTEGAALERQPLGDLDVSEPFDHAPCLVSLPSGATLEVYDAGGLLAGELHRAGGRLPLAVRLQQLWPAVIIALAAIVALLVGIYLKGLPAAARWVAFALPPRLEARMGDQLLTVLDQHVFGPSHLDSGRRTRISDRFTRGAATSMVPYRLEFRAATNNAVNAMALPGGIIILLDGLVEFAGDEDAVLGVLGHELGHVLHRHSTRQILQSVGVGAVASLFWGDFSGVAASLPVALGVLRYSREFEREADEFAIAFLHSENLSIQALYQLFDRLRRLESRHGTAAIPDFISTHPSSEERLERLRREMR